MEKEKHELNLKTRVFNFKEENDTIRKLEVSTGDLEYIFKGMRPRLMSPEDFRAIRIQLKKELAHYLKGELIHLSKVSDEVWANYTKDMKHKPKQKGHTYVKKQETSSGDNN
jgi:hypothetical protein